MDDPEIDDTVLRLRRPRAAGPPDPGFTSSSSIDDTIITARPPRGTPVNDNLPDGFAVASNDVANVGTDKRTAHGFRLNGNGGEAHSIDRVVVMGRSPRLSQLSGRVVHRTVVVSSPNREVSANHLALAPQGDAVLVTDLRSTNGTVVTLPNASPVALRPGESLVVGSGTRIVLGDGNWVEIFALKISGGSDE